MKVLLMSDLHRELTHNTHLIHDKFLKEVSEQDFDICVIAGDICSTRQTELGSFFAHYRKHLPTKETYVVPGNHDFWNDNGHLPLRIKKEHWTYECHDNQIIDLNGRMIETHGVKIYGWHNWYGTSRFLRGTNDEYHLSVEEDLLLYKEDMDSFWKYVDDKVVADILVNHIPIISDPVYNRMGGIIQQWDTIKENNMLPKVYLHGHTHVGRDTVVDGVRVVMCGSDYDKPKYVILEVL